MTFTLKTPQNDRPTIEQHFNFLVATKPDIFIEWEFCDYDPYSDMFYSQATNFEVEVKNCFGWVEFPTNLK